MAVARILYEHQGAVRQEDGAVEILTEARTVLLDGASDGETLRVVEGPWTDPFAANPSEQNDEFLRTHGRWRRVDCSAKEHYVDLIGREIGGIVALQNRWGRLGGVRLSTSGRDMWVFIDGDECHVSWGPPDGFSEM